MADDPGVRPAPSFGVVFDADGAVARVWAPGARTVAVRAAGGAEPDATLVREPNGCFAGRVAWMGRGRRYWIVLDGGREMPDPASRFQPEGVHGPSEAVDCSTFEWRHEAWQVPAREDVVIYELHVGTFTQEGTFDAAAERLPALADLGVTVVELMPVAAFPGRWNWGYDPAALFAPSERYGRPEALCRFVDKAHGLGLAVILDVVYNHFGPDGAYAAAASTRFFSDRHRSPWGAGINLDGPGSGEVRRFFIENALQWLSDYRMDGLRLDAVHALVDEGPVHFLRELSDTVRTAVHPRRVLLVAEDDRNLRRLVDPVASGGFGLDAVWADDFHHACRRLVAGDHEGYFADFEGTTDEIAEAVSDGWIYKGAASVFAGGPRGTNPAGLPRADFVICLQNHDQVGNRPFGDRLQATADAAAIRALTVLLLLAPESPLLFMGQEWAASTPFMYFTDHHGELGRLVAEGRRREFGAFSAFADPAARERIPNPQSPDTFLRSRLDWSERDQDMHVGMLHLHREALALRRRLVPAPPSGEGPAVATPSGPDGLVMYRHDDSGSPIAVIVRLRGAGVVPAAGLPLAGVSAVTTPEVWLSTETRGVVDDPKPARVEAIGGVWCATFARPGALVVALGQGRAHGH